MVVEQRSHNGFFRQVVFDNFERQKIRKKESEKLKQGSDEYFKGGDDISVKLLLNYDRFFKQVHDFNLGRRYDAFYTQVGPGIYISYLTHYPGDGQSHLVVS